MDELLLKELEVIKTGLETKSASEVKAQITAFETKNKEVIDLAVKDVRDALELQIKAIQDHADNLDIKLNAKKIETKGHATLRGALMAAFEEKSAEIKSIIAAGGKQSESLLIEVKAVTDMSVTNTIGAGPTQVSITDNTGIVSTIRKRRLTYRAFVSNGSTSGNRAMWIEELDEQGNPVFLAEGAPKTQASVRYEERTANVKKAAVYGKITTEMMADLPQLISYIENNLLKRLQIVVENQLFSGDNLGDNLNGIKKQATAFTAGAAALSIVQANEFDVLDALGTQSDLAFGDPNAVFVHPTTLQKMRAIKSTTGEPLYKDYLEIQGNNNVLMIHNMIVVPTTMIPAGEFLGGDMTTAHVLDREGISMQIGLDGNDFTNNKKTILLEQRLVQFLSANDAPTIIKGTFAAAITALNKV